MKAIRKSDSKVIEVTERTSWNGETIYTADGTFYRKHELDFSVGEAKEAEGEVLSGWVARDMDGNLFIYDNPPTRTYNGVYSQWSGNGIETLPNNMFPSLTWDSEPMEVEITIKPKKKLSTK